MNKIIMSAITALTLGTVSATAGELNLYQDEVGQVFTTPAEGRTLIKNKSTSVFSHSDKLKFSGDAYIGLTSNNYDDATKATTTQFELRRGYIQLKAYLLDDPKSYYRVTFDINKEATGDENIRTKYAYLYLNNILPATGVEIGLAHRPWHDYEEHNAWYYRNISKVFIEDKKSGPDLSNSADYGVMFKTRTKYFDADYGIFNGEGYHGNQNSDAPSSLSFEWRTTAHILGTSGKPTKTTYWDASFFGQYNKKHKSVTVGTIKEQQDLIFGGLHTVYNQPSFLVAAQYVKSQDTSDIANNISKQAGSGYSVNAEYRLGAKKEYRLLARYDSWTPDIETTYNGTTATREDSSYILGAAWEQNKNVQWVTNTIITDNEDGSAKQSNNGTAYMVTAEVKF